MEYSRRAPANTDRKGAKETKLGNFSKNTSLRSETSYLNITTAVKGCPKWNPSLLSQLILEFFSMLFHVLLSFPEIPSPNLLALLTAAHHPNPEHVSWLTRDTWILGSWVWTKEHRVGFESYLYRQSRWMILGIFLHAPWLSFFIYMREIVTVPASTGLSGRLIELIGIKWFH